MADSYLYIEDFQVTNAQRGTEIEIPVKAHFDARVTSFVMTLHLPEGLQYTGFRPGSSSGILFINGDGTTCSASPDDYWFSEEDDSETIFYCEAPNILGFWDPLDMNIPSLYECYGRIKWEAGDYDEMMVITVLVDEHYSGGLVDLETIPYSEEDTRGGTVLENGDHGQEFVATSSISAEMEVTPMPEIVVEVVDMGVEISAIGEGQVNLYVNGEPMENPSYFYFGPDVEVLYIEATAQAEGKQISETATMYYELPPLPEPYFNVWREITDDEAIYHIEADGEVVVYFNGENVELPEAYYSSGTFTIPRSDVDQYYEVHMECMGYYGMVIAPYDDYLVLPARGSLYDFEADGIYYKIIGYGKVSVTYRDLNFNTYSGDVNIPETTTCEGVTFDVVAIRGHAFYGCDQLTSVNLPNSLTDIGAGAFRFSSLPEVTIPSSVKTIGNCAFLIRSGFQRVNITDLFAWCKIDFETAYANPLNYAHHLFLNGTEVTDLVIPDRSTVKRYSFYGCTGLSSVVIPDAVTSVGKSAFGECTGMTSLTLGNSLKMIGDSAFYKCSGLTSVVLPDALETLGYWAFTRCTGLSELTLNNTLKVIGRNAFSYCSALTEVVIPNSVETIGNGAFYNCQRLASVTMGNSVKTIEGTAFYNCYALTRAVIPNTVDSIGPYAFNGCKGLTSLTLSNSLKTIGYNAFNYCIALTSVVIPNSVKTIGSYAFCDCRSLTSVTIGSSVTKIGDGGFYRCSALQTVTCLALTPPRIDNSTFSSCYTTATLRVPQSSLETYQTTNYWKKFTTIVGIPGAGPGVINGDGELNLTDVTLLINALINGELSVEDNPYADLNGDGEVNLTDITMLISNLINAH